jgi:hypothetical protein
MSHPTTCAGYIYNQRKGRDIQKREVRCRNSGIIEKFILALFEHGFNSWLPVIDYSSASRIG